MSRALVAIRTIAVVGVSLGVAGLAIIVWAIAVDFNSTDAFGGSLLPIVAVGATGTGATLVATAVRERRRLRS